MNNSLGIGMDRLLGFMLYIYIRLYGVYIYISVLSPQVSKRTALYLKND